MNSFIAAIAKEPPFRCLVKPLIRVIPVSPETKSFWDAVGRPQYLFGVLHAARHALHAGYSAVSVIEFGVATGHGLLALQAHAAAVERWMDIRIHVYGFDSGNGLPKGTGDYRDHPDYWKAGDFPMDENVIREHLDSRTTLVLGDVSATVMKQVFAAPIGFAALDLDLYSSTIAALAVLRRPDVHRLRRIALYFDDVNEGHNHQFAGELLAIDEFNRDSPSVKIDRWHGIRSGRPFYDAPWLDGMYVAHDLAAISQMTLSRSDRRL
jgi:hypothetical protein